MPVMSWLCQFSPIFIGLIVGFRKFLKTEPMGSSSLKIKLCGDSLIYPLKCIFEGVLQGIIWEVKIQGLIQSLLLQKSIWLPARWFLHFPIIVYCSQNNSSFDCNPTIDVRGVFVDISKSFKVWHGGFLFKLESYCIGGELLNLFKNYIQERQQWLVLKGTLIQIWKCTDIFVCI